MSLLIFDLKKNKNKNRFEMNYSPEEKKPIKLIADSTINLFKFNETKKFPKIFQVKKNNILINKKILLDIKRSSYDKNKSIYQTINIDKKLKQPKKKIISRNISKELIQEEDCDIFSYQINSEQRSNTINNNSRLTPRKFNHIKSIRGGDQVISHSIDVLNNNQNNNVSRFIKNVYKKENNIKNLLKRRYEDSTNNFYIKKKINMSPIQINNRYDVKTINRYDNRKINIMNNELDSSNNLYNSKKELLLPELNIINKRTKNKKRSVLADIYKELSKKKNQLEIKLDLDNNKDEEQSILNSRNYKRNDILLNNDIFPITNNFHKKINKTEKELNYNSNFNRNLIKHINSKKEYLEMISDDSLNEYYVKKCNIILEYAYKEERNLPYRSYMEDKGKSILNYNNDKNKLLFCLFDGHGGDEVSTYLQKNFFKIMKKYLNEKDENEEINFEQLFKEIDEEFKGGKYYQIGSTATIIYITKELVDENINETQKVLYCINIGDTKCILTQTTGSRKLSFDDLLTDKSEYNRIIEGGGYIKNGRVCGKLMISRAFGDWEIKQHGLICTPHVTKLCINKDCKYVIVATDGIWDALDDLDVYKLSLSTENSKNLCDDIIKNALEKKSRDNLSCFVIKLND